MQHHAPHTDGGSDERNYHAHIMFTTRAIDARTGNFSAKNIVISVETQAQNGLPLERVFCGSHQSAFRESRL